MNINDELTSQEKRALKEIRDQYLKNGCMSQRVKEIDEALKVKERPVRRIEMDY
jgi:hypothetical protein